MRALLVTHGELGRALLDSARQIYAVEAPIDVLSNDDLGLSELQGRVVNWLEEAQGPALIMVDVGGGSCGVAARGAVAGRAQTYLLGGANLPMVLTFLSSHAHFEPQELVSKMLDRALHAVAPLSDTD